MPVPWWLAKLFPKQSPSRRAGRKAPKKSRRAPLHLEGQGHVLRLRLEVLEERLAPSVTTIASFPAPNGILPTGGVIGDSSGNLFGTTYRGGASGYGTVFEVAAGSGTITPPASFNNTNGANPESRLVEWVKRSVRRVTLSTGAP